MNGGVGGDEGADDDIVADVDDEGDDAVVGVGDGDGTVSVKTDVGKEASANPKAEDEDDVDDCRCVDGDFFCFLACSSNKLFCCQ